MAQKILKTRIKQRIDTAENWAKITEAPLEGEIIIYKSTDDTIPDKVKIGDGVTTASNLPFITDIDTNNLSAGVRIPESETNTLGSTTQGIYWENGRPQLMTYTLGKSVPSNALFTDTNTKVTSAANHYTPQTDSSSALSVDASSTTAATWGTTNLVTGVNLTRDSKGHVTGMTVDSIKMPANPNTTYSAGTGLSLNGTEFNHSNSVTAGTASEGGNARTLAFGGSFNIPSVTYDAQGHITGKGSIALKLPANPNVDTGATSVEVTGTGNAITTATYDASTRKITLTKGATYNNYSLPAAGTSLGGIKTGGVATITDGVITAISGAGSATTAVTANKVANSLSIQGNGTGITFDGSAAKTVNIKGSGTVSVTGDTSGVITITGSAHPTSLKNPNALTVNVNGTSTSYDGSAAKSITINAAALGLSSAMQFGGVVTSLPESSTAGTVVLYGSKEYVYDANGNWVELGDEGSHALKTIKITANAGLNGGGTLASDITIGHANSITAGTVQGGSGTLSHGGTFTVPKITYDAYGHITGATTTTYTLPSDSDTHYTANLYLGASGASANVTTATSNPYLVLRENGATRNNIQLKGSAGISVSGVSGVATIGHTNSITAGTAQGSATGTLSFGGTFTIPTITYDAQGHITGKGTTTLTMPANPNTDTHWTSNLIAGASATATANAAASDGSVYLNLVENGSIRNSHLIDGAGTVTVTSDANGKITITGSAHPTVNNATITVAAGAGLTGTGNFTTNQSSAKTITLAHSNSITAGTASGGSGQLSHNGTFTVPSITYDAQGHITGTSTTTYTLPADNNTDTKVTQAAAITTNGNYPVLLAYSTATTAVTDTVNKSSTLLYNPSTGTLSATKFSGNGNALTNINAVQLTLASGDELILDCNS